MNIKYVFFDCWDTVIKYHENEPNGDMKAIHPYLVEKDNGKKIFGARTNATNKFNARLFK